MENQPATGNYQIHLTLSLPRLGRMRKVIPVIAALVSLLFVSLGPALAFSTKLKGEGDAEYAKQNYAGALLKYEAAKSWWLPERISPKLRDRDLEAKTAKAEIMVKSAENYTKGIEAFNKKQYPEAKGFLSLLAFKDPHYQSSQDTLKDIEKIEEELLKPTPTPTPKQPSGVVSPQTTSQPPSPSPTSTPSDSRLWSSEPKRDPTHPVIIRVSDSLGNYTTGSTGNGIPFFVTWPKPEPKLKLGQSVVITTEADDPKGSNLLYRFKVNNRVVQDWGENKALNWTVSPDTGGNPFVVAEIKNSDGFNRYGDTDDSTVLYYLAE